MLVSLGQTGDLPGALESALHELAHATMGMLAAEQNNLRIVERFGNRNASRDAGGHEKGKLATRLRVPTRFESSDSRGQEFQGSKPGTHGTRKVR